MRVNRTGAADSRGNPKARPSERATGGRGSKCTPWEIVGWEKKEGEDV